MKLVIYILVLFGSIQFSFAGQDDLGVTDAWMRPVILENRPAAVYLTITNKTIKDDKLIKAVSAMATRIEFHNHTHENGVMRMSKVKDIPVAANSIVRIEPGGYHLMIYGLSMKYGIGDEFPFMLTFAKAGRVPVIAKVMKKAP